MSGSNSSKGTLDERVGTRARWRVAVVVVVSTTLLGIIAFAFWYWDLRYSKPTPRPPDLVQVPLGTSLPVPDWLARGGLDAGGRPVHLHFFNPACPCSRFNLDHLRTLVRSFGANVFFVAVVQSELADIDGPEGRRELESLVEELGIPWIADRGGAMAAAAGVYATPQAVIVTGEGALYYRGNYNTSRYCTDPRTEFARLALESLVREDQPLAAAAHASAPAYGCELPSKTTQAKSRLSLQETQP